MKSITHSRLYREALLVFGITAVAVVVISTLFQLGVLSTGLGLVGSVMGTAVTILLGVLVLVAGFVYAQLVSRRLRQLLRGVDAVSKGEFPLLLVRDDDDIAKLTVGFNRMVEELRARDDSLTTWADRKESELVDLSRSLDTEKEKLETLLENVGEGVIVLDMDGRVIMANEQVSEMFGVPTNTLARADLPALIEQLRHRVVNMPKVEEQLRQMQASGQGVNEVVLELDGQGGPAIRLYTTPVRGADGTMLGRIATLMDLGKEREVDRLKSEFLSTISHELRTPLTSVKGALGLIRGGAAGPLSVDMRELLEIASTNVERLINVINNILDVLSLERGQAGMRFTPMALPDCVVRAAGLVSHEGARAGVAVETTLPPDLPPVRGDFKRIEQVMVNLLSNAIKFSPRGQKVLVRASSDDGKVTVTVRDFGKGIPREAIGRLFQKFEHPEESLTRGSQGAGLGLAICRHIVEAHGGRIWVESTEGRGSTFSFTIPADQRTADPLLRPLRNNRSVLVVDDDEDTVKILSRIFQAEGYRVLASYRGEEALELARKHRPDLLTLDLHMPRVDGYQVLNALRRDPNTAPIPVICISVDPDPGKALAQGADYFLSKPVDIDRLRQLAASVFERTGGAA